MTIEIGNNKSKTYFLPLFALFVKIGYLKKLQNTYFWYDEDIGVDTFSLLYKFDGKVHGDSSNRKGFTIYEETLFQHPYFKSYADYDEYVIYNFTLEHNDGLIKARDLIVRGKYSKLSKEQKNHIIDFMLAFHGPTSGTLVKKVLFQDEKLRQRLGDELGVVLPEDAELSSAPEIQDEIFLMQLT